MLPADRIRKVEFQRPSAAVIQGCRDLSHRTIPDVAGLLARALDRLGLVGAVPGTKLFPLSPNQFLVGPAVTVRNLPERDAPLRRWQGSEATRLGEREAFFVAAPGDVIVIEGGSTFPASCLGPMSAVVAKQLGIEGVVVAGAVTGVPGIRRVGLPVWAYGATPLTGHHRTETVEINGPIGFDGVRVDPGDLIVADDSGVCVIPATKSEQVLETAQAMSNAWTRMQALVERNADREAIRLELTKAMRAVMGSQLTKE